MEEQGTGYAKYLVVPRTLIFIFHEDEVLLLKGAPTKKIWAGLYNGIGGHVEPGEDILSSAKRELQEESGLTDIQLYLCGQVMIDTGLSPGVALYVFKGDSTTRKTISSIEGSPEWVSVDQIRTVRMVNDLYQLLPRVILWQQGQEIIYAKYAYSIDGELLVSFSD